MVERTDDHPGTGSATYCSAVSLRQASRTLVLAQRSYANNATTSSCMRISPGLGQRYCRYCRAILPALAVPIKHMSARIPTAQDGFGYATQRSNALATVMRQW